MAARIADMHLHNVSIASPSLTGVAIAALAIYWAGLVLYRLFFHPLAKFPGPRWAAVTSWYEAYYEIVKKGQYSKKISQLHDQYGVWSPDVRLKQWLTTTQGPIIRVTPHEIHIRDSRFFDEVYPRNVHLDKEGWDKRFGSEGGVLPTPDAQVHKLRRAALTPMYVCIQPPCGEDRVSLAMYCCAHSIQVLSEVHHRLHPHHLPSC